MVGPKTLVSDAIGCSDKWGPSSTRVVLDAKPDVALSAHVSQIASSASQGTGRFAVEVRTDDANDALPSGLSSPLALVILDAWISSTLLPRIVMPVLYKRLAPVVVHEALQPIAAGLADAIAFSS